MAKLYKNDKGFLIIQMNLVEALLRCDIGNFCDNCNNRIDIAETDGYDDIYYIAVINRAVCKNCCEDFIKGYNKNPEDKSYEKSNYNRYAKLLNLEEI